MKGEMMHNIEDLHELCETISREIGDANEKMKEQKRNSGSLFPNSKRCNVL